MTKAADLHAQECAFSEYVALARKAQQSCNLADAIAAGKAWARFLALFCDGAPE
jgi:hypothetical protein